MCQCVSFAAAPTISLLELKAQRRYLEDEYSSANTCIEKWLVDCL